MTMKARLFLALGCGAMMALGGCALDRGAERHTDGLGPDVQVSRKIAAAPTLFSGKAETTSGRADQRYLRREAYAHGRPIATLSELGRAQSPY